MYCACVGSESGEEKIRFAEVVVSRPAVSHRNKSAAAVHLCQRLRRPAGRDRHHAPHSRGQVYPRTAGKPVLLRLHDGAAAILYWYWY